MRGIHLEEEEEESTCKVSNSRPHLVPWTAQWVKNHGPLLAVKTNTHLVAVKIVMPLSEAPEDEETRINPQIRLPQPWDSDLTAQDQRRRRPLCPSWFRSWRGG